MSAPYPNLDEQKRIAEKREAEKARQLLKNKQINTKLLSDFLAEVKLCKIDINALVLSDPEAVIAMYTRLRTLDASSKKVSRNFLSEEDVDVFQPALEQITSYMQTLESHFLSVMDSKMKTAIKKGDNAGYVALLDVTHRAYLAKLISWEQYGANNDAYNDSLDSQSDKTKKEASCTNISNHWNAHFADLSNDKWDEQ